MKSYKYVIVGSSAAGISALNKLWQLDPKGSALCITAQKDIPYNKCFLADLALGDKSEQAIALRIMHQQAEFKYNTTVLEINKEKKSVRLSDNTELLFQKLLLATGADPIMPPIEGIDLPHVITFHTLSNVHAIDDYIKDKKITNAAVIGAGLTGLECADVLNHHGVRTAVVERNAHALAAQLAYEGAALIENRMAAEGVRLYTQATAVRITPEHIELLDGTKIPADLVVIAAGVQPNNQLAVGANLDLSGRHMKVDEYMQSSDPTIYGAGDLVSVYDQLTRERIPSCTWPDAMHQGLIAAHAMAEKPKKYPGALSITSSAFFGMKFASTGVNHSAENGYTIFDKTKTDNEFLRIVLKGGVPVGFQHVGSSLANLSEIRRAMLTKQPISLNS